jgi:hypothetical protein
MQKLTIDVAALLEPKMELEVVYNIIICLKLLLKEE